MVWQTVSFHSITTKKCIILVLNAVNMYGCILQCTYSVRSHGQQYSNINTVKSVFWIRNSHKQDFWNTSTRMRSYSLILFRFLYICELFGRTVRSCQSFRCILRHEHFDRADKRFGKSPCPVLGAGRKLLLYELTLLARQVVKITAWRTLPAK